MVVDDKLLAKLEKLSAIKIEDDKKDEIKGQIGEILNFVENLNSLEIKTGGFKAQDCTPLRDDVVIKSDVAESVLSNAPKKEDRFFIVPKIVE